MPSTDLSSSSEPHVHTRVSLRQPLRCGFTIVLCSCLFFGAAQCRAQASQEVAEAARQERARKDQAKKQKHVYTDEDLRRAKILTPEDEALAEANRKQQPQPAEEQAQAPIDADTTLAQLPLGDIARRYRNAKIAAQTPDPFHLPFGEPGFAAPVISVPELESPRPSFSPAHPNIARAHHRAVVAPAIPITAPLRRVDPFTPRFGPPSPPAVVRIAPPARQPKADPAIAPSAQPRTIAPAMAPSTPKSARPFRSLRRPPLRKLLLRRTPSPCSPAILSGRSRSKASATARAGRNCWRLTRASWTPPASPPAQKSWYQPESPA